MGGSFAFRQNLDKQVNSNVKKEFLQKIPPNNPPKKSSQKNPPQKILPKKILPKNRPKKSSLKSRFSTFMSQTDMTQNSDQLGHVSPNKESGLAALVHSDPIETIFPNSDIVMDSDTEVNTISDGGVIDETIELEHVDHNETEDTVRIHLLFDDV